MNIIIILLFIQKQIIATNFMTDAAVAIAKHIINENNKKKAEKTEKLAQNPNKPSNIEATKNKKIN